MHAPRVTYVSTAATWSHAEVPDILALCRKTKGWAVLSNNHHITEVYKVIAKAMAPTPGVTARTLFSAATKVRSSKHLQEIQGENWTSGSAPATCFYYEKWDRILSHVAITEPRFYGGQPKGH